MNANAKGTPLALEPPFTWQESARDAVAFYALNLVNDWTVPRVLYELERFNGFGYRKNRVPTPYLWSCTSHYIKGRWENKGFNPEGVFSRCGAAALLKVLIERKLVALN